MGNGIHLGVTSIINIRVIEVTQCEADGDKKPKSPLTVIALADEKSFKFVLNVYIAS